MKLYKVNPGTECVVFFEVNGSEVATKTHVTKHEFSTCDYVLDFVSYSNGERAKKGTKYTDLFNAYSQAGWAIFITGDEKYQYIAFKYSDVDILC